MMVTKASPTVRVSTTCCELPDALELCVCTSSALDASTGEPQTQGSGWNLAMIRFVILTDISSSTSRNLLVCTVQTEPVPVGEKRFL
jgi:hypothetical protein